MGTVLYAGLQIADHRTAPDTPLRTETHATLSSSPLNEGSETARAEASPKPNAVPRARYSKIDAIDQPTPSELPKAVPPAPAPTLPATFGHPKPARAPVAAKKPKGHANPRSRAATNTAAEASTQATVSGAVPTRQAGAEAPTALNELELLEEAQHALVRDPARSLELVRQHRAIYPDGAFSQERDVLALEVLSRLERTRDLRERAQTFLERYPRSPHKARVQTLLDRDLGH